MAFLLIGGAITPVLSADEPSDNVSPSDIFKHTQEKYASLTSYTDEGKIVAHVNGMAITTTFTIKLARPSLYRIDWEQDLFTMKGKPQAVWSAGDGDFMEMGGGAKKQASQEMALAGATGISGGAAATVPGSFFHMSWGNQFGGSASNEKRGADEKIGDANCYVLTNESSGRTRTLWIGKEDFLIHQVRTVTSAEAVKATMEMIAKRHPESAPPPSVSAPQGITSIETHTNIIENPKLSAADFAPSKE